MQAFLSKKSFRFPLFYSRKQTNKQTNKTRTKTNKQMKNIRTDFSWLDFRKKELDTQCWLLFSKTRTLKFLINMKNLKQSSL